MREKTCCFTGHRLIPAGEYAGLQWEVEQAVEWLIQKGIFHFITGGALGFDTLAAEVILKLREKHPHIRLHLLLPCWEQEKYWNERQRKLYQEILFQADQVEYLAEHYFNGCMQWRNRTMVERSAYCVAYCTRYTGGAAYTIRQARRAETKLILLAGSSTENRKNGSGTMQITTAVETTYNIIDQDERLGRPPEGFLRSRRPE